MKIRNIALLSALAPTLVFAADATRKIEVKNPSGEARFDVPVAMKITDFDLGFQPTAVVVTVDGVELPSQLDDLNRDNAADELAFVIDLKGKEKRMVELAFSDTQAQKQYEPRTFAQLYVRGYQNAIVPLEDISVDGDVDSYTLLYGHGVMFESELNGYRIYFDPKQTFDPYGKFSKGLELEACKFYPNDEQLAAGFGDDVLMVGKTCGIGALKGWNGTTHTNIAPVRRRSQRLISSGPVRAIVQVKDECWQYSPESTLTMTETMTQWAGHRDVDVDVQFDKPLGNEEFVAGVMNVMGNETEHQYGHNTVASWGRHWPVGDTIKFAKERVGIATWVPKAVQKRKAEDADGFYYVISAPGRSGFQYSTMFTSSKERDFGVDSFPAWVALTEDWRRQKEAPVQVKIVK